MEKKLAVLFPGMGYTCMKPLLYYADALCRQMGYETVRLDYGQIPHDKEKAFPLACERVMPQVLSLPYSEYEDVVFIGKSLGTILAAVAAKKLASPVRQVFLTPVEDTIAQYQAKDEKARAIALSGSADPWAPDHGKMRGLCGKKNILFFSFPGTDHSLETEDVDANLENMKRVVSIIRSFLENSD